MAFHSPSLLLTMALMVNGGTALFIDFTINTTAQYDQELTCSASCNGPNCSNIKAISSIDIIEVQDGTERRIATLNSVLQKPISLCKGVVTKMDGTLSEKGGLLKLGVKTDKNVLKYACKAAFCDSQFDTVTIEKEQENKSNVLVAMLNQCFAGIASREKTVVKRLEDMSLTLSQITKRLDSRENTVEDSFSKISVAVKKVQDQLDIKSNEVFKKLEDMSLTLSQITHRLDGMDTETNEETNENPVCLFTSCNVYRNGAVPASSPLMPITLPDSSPVLCDTVTDGGGWTIFQRRVNGNVYFYRDWASYEEGFGNISSNYWLGLKTLRSLMNDGRRELRVDIEYKGKRYYAKYSQFSIGDASSNYKLHVSGYSGDAGDSLVIHNGMAFTTFDRDNDKWNDRNCAQVYSGAWWYNGCHGVNLNGKWGEKSNKGPRWGTITGSDPASWTEMKTRLVL